MSSALSFNK
jgi:hypothetical protein